MKYLFFWVFVLLGNSSLAQPNWNWAAGGGSSLNDKGQSVTVDVMGNVYVTGSFAADATLDTTHLVCKGAQDMFVAKYSASGQLKWVRQGGGINDDEGNGVAADAIGNVYVTGYFTDTAYFGNNVLLSNGETDIFLIKYDSSGIIQWIKTAGGIYPDIASDIAISKTGMIVISGNFAGYNGGITVYGTAQFDTATITSKGASDVFIAKYGADGSLIMAKNAGGGVYDEYGFGLAIDANNNIFCSGTFREPYAFFDTTKLISANSINVTSNAFLAKYDSNGHILWARQANGVQTSANLGIFGVVSGKKLAVDKQGNAYLCGFYKNCDLRFGSLSIGQYGNADAFCAKYDASGSLVWAKKAGGYANDGASKVIADTLGNVYFTGNFTGNAIFGKDTINLPGAHLFITKCNSNGEFEWVKSTNSAGVDVGYGIAVSAGGAYIYVTGSYSGNALNLGTTTLLNNGGSDIFTGRLSAPVSVTELKTAKNDCKIYPNPTNGVVTIQSKEEITEISISDVQGKTVKRLLLPAGTNNQIVDIAYLSPGLYYVHCKTIKGYLNEKITIK